MNCIKINFFQRDIPKIRHFKFLIIFFLVLSFAVLILALIGATQTFNYQNSFEKPSAPPLGIEYVFFAIGDIAIHVTIFIIVDIIHKKFKHFEIRREIYKENSNLNVVASYQPHPRSNVHMRIPEIELPPPPSKF